MVSSISKKSAVFFAVISIGVGCGKSEPAKAPEPVQKVEEPMPAAAPAPEAAPAIPAPAPAGPSAPIIGTENPDGSITVNLESVGETMMFNTGEIKVPAGKKVTINLKNNATLDVMKHNFVLVQNGKAEEVGMAGAAAGEAKGYISDNPAIIAKSPLAGPGATVSVTFDAPAAGEYQFVCTFPGHYVMMKGKFVVVA